MSDVPSSIVPPPAEGSTAPTTTTPTTTTAVGGDKKDLQADADRLIAEGKKAIALKQWEEGVTKYADALDIMREIVGEFDPKMAPLLLSYGKALYELAWSQQGVMGKEEVDKTAEGARSAVQEDQEEAGPAGGNFSFAEPTFDGEGEAEGEGEGEEVEGGDEDGPEVQDAEGEAEGAGDGVGEVDGGDVREDDFNAAWEVLDVARTIYLKTLDEHPGQDLEEQRLQLADTYIALGDVSCETENFPQAVSDYTSALNIQTKLLPTSSRSLASTHYQLATSLEFIPQKRTEALSHVQKALESFTALRTELQSYTPNSTGGSSETIKKMSVKERETELKDVESLLGDLEVKIEELKAAPEVPDLVTQSIDHLLGKQLEASGSAGGIGFGAPGAGVGAGGSGSGADATPVNDLTSMVRKKPAKKTAQAAPAPATANASGSASADGNGELKRKVEEAANGAGSETKKAKAE